MIDSILCEILDIKYPIIQGGMAWIANGKLAAAVSNAGGLGIISAMNSASLVEQVSIAREYTDKPIGVNIMLMNPEAEKIAAVVCELEIDVITTGAGLPNKFMPMWREAGVKVIPVVASASVAKLVERSGATAVIAEGCEAGGHVGEIGTMALVPVICDAVSIPVIAAGGIADGRGMAAAMMLGAKGIQCGTVFLSAHECDIHDVYKEKVLSAKDTDTILTGKRLGHPVRSLKNSFSRNFFKMEYDGNISNEELESYGSGSLRKAVVDGDTSGGSFMAGQSAALVKTKRSCEEIVSSIANEASALLLEASKWVR
ncbi:MAG: enoyl-[acyl-carrier-protein] reductase FabK [Ruminococcaceae bacterium]|nr:enoyl-[acyl-carrier-protein] reductase FabK [Oscillospiraceae bacterium]